MNENRRSSVYYDLPLYMRIFPNFYDFHGYEYYKKPRKRDAFEEFLNLYSVFAFYGMIRPNGWYNGTYYW